MEKNATITVDLKSGAEISVLAISAQVRSRLRRSGIRFVAELEALTAGELICLEEIGGGCMKAIRRALSEFGTKLSGEECIKLGPMRKRRKSAA